MVVDDDSGGGTSPWIWVAALLGLLILVLVGFVAFQFLDRGGSTPIVERIEVPNLVGLSFEQAEAEAARQGFEVTRDVFEPSDEPEGTVLSQDPAAGAEIPKGGRVRLTIAAGRDVVAVPDLRLRPETQAIQLILQAGLQVGDRTDAFDPVVPIGSVISQDPRAGLEVPRDEVVNYVVSSGPEPTESPSPSPTPVAVAVAVTVAEPEPIAVAVPGTDPGADALADTRADADPHTRADPDPRTDPAADAGAHPDPDARADAGRGRPTSDAWRWATPGSRSRAAACRSARSRPSRRTSRSTTPGSSCRRTRSRTSRCRRGRRCCCGWSTPRRPAPSVTPPQPACFNGD